MLWAGPEHVGRVVREGHQPVQGAARRTAPVALRLGFAADDFGYAIDLGLPPAGAMTAFGRDPVIKRECVRTGLLLRPSAVLCDRIGGFVRVRDDAGGWSAPFPIRDYDSMLSEFADPERAPELLGLRDRIRSWRFYDQFRTDAAAPARGSHVGTRTPVLGQGGADLAAALQTIKENGDEAGLDSAVAAAFPGSAVTITQTDDGRLSVAFHQHGLVKDFGQTQVAGRDALDQPSWRWPKR